MRLDELLAWQEGTPELPPFVPDYHRLQIEYWLYQELRHLQGQPWKRVLDIGVEYRKPYIQSALGCNYVALNEDDATRAAWHWALPLPDRPDLLGDVQQLPYAEASFHYVLCTETFEHVPNPWRAIGEIYRVLRPGGHAFLSAPFMWPWHGSARYADFWRFTADGWRLLCGQAGFKSVRVFPTAFRADSPVEQLMVTENMGQLGEVRWASGYLIEAGK